jgi:DNA-binding NarL/FixJ family response regulator
VTEPIRVLVVEDEPGMRLALTSVVDSEPSLALAGTASDADEAIETARRVQPDVCLLDVRMPGGGGAHATRAIVEHSPGTRIVALSGLQDRDTVLEMADAGAIGYLVKGATPSELTDAIHAAARGEQRFPSHVRVND